VPDGRRIVKHPVLEFNHRDKVTFCFEGRSLSGWADDTVASALVANGIDVFRHTERGGRPRGFFCAVGKCASCLMVIDGRPNVMACVEPLREGMRVERQRGRGRLL
jgi:predicted molibdopterin-dependent oxidoreductase YjgC